MDKIPETRVAEADLIERCRAGEPTAFDEVIRMHRRSIYAVARRILGRHEDADEAAQETFVRAWRGIRRFRGESALRTWLIGIAVNVSRSLEARRRRVEETACQADPPGADPTPEETLARKNLASRVRAGVEALPPRQREVVLLKVFEDLTYAEVAGIMQLTEGAVKAHLHQAVSNLRRHLACESAGRRK